MVQLSSGARHTVRLAWGGLYPEAARPSRISADDWRQRQQELEIWFDGTSVLKKQAGFATDLTVQPIDLGGAGGPSVFSGLIHDVRRLPDPR